MDYHDFLVFECYKEKVQELIRGSINNDLIYKSKVYDEISDHLVKIYDLLNERVIEDGQYVCDNNVLEFNNGKLEGKQIKYFNDNSIDTMSEYHNGVLNGIYEKFHKNGHLEIIADYHNGLRDGIYEKYYSNGNPKFRTYYKNGLLHGCLYIFHKNERLETEAHHTMGEPCGIWKLFDDEGRLLDTADFTSDQEPDLVNTFTIFLKNFK